jgi:hypothetical protein
MRYLLYVNRFRLIILLTVLSVLQNLNLDVNYAYKPIVAEFQLCCFSLWTGIIRVVSQALCVNIHDLRTSGPELQIPCSLGIFMVKVATRDSASLLPVLPNHWCHKLWYILGPKLIAHHYKKINKNQQNYRWNFFISNFY